jgi:hypothetical protein
LAMYMKVATMRIARILSASVILVLLVEVQPASCEGWSLPNPFSSKSTTETKRRPLIRPAKKQPTVLDKIGTGTKNFFNKTGETLGLKKPEKRVQYTVATPKPRNITPSKTETKSWLPSFLKPEPPKKEKMDVKDWIAQPRQDM